MLGGFSQCFSETAGRKARVRTVNGHSTFIWLDVQQLNACTRARRGKQWRYRRGTSVRWGWCVARTGEGGSSELRAQPDTGVRSCWKFI
jgi:hypothetical protein